MENKKGLFVKLFLSMLQISAFTFGGGFVIVSLMKKRFVDGYHWLDEDEMLDLTALAQSSPGAIAVNGAILVGYKVAGFPGMVISVLGTILPPMVILSVVSVFYNTFATNLYVALVLRGMQAGVAAIITDVVFSLGAKVLKDKNYLHDLLIILSFCAVFFLKINVAVIILVAGVIGLIEGRIARRSA
ncbi:MAG: chromate transporter [Sphaerochaetaceae bacterium]|nr:chromate transporter [Sphaerochaetaceae bacterium]